MRSAQAAPVPDSSDGAAEPAWRRRALAALLGFLCHGTFLVAVTAMFLGLHDGLTAGVLDILDAFVMTVINGGTPTRVLHSIASGVLGPSAFEGGAATAALGLFLHFLIACGMAAAYWLACRQWLVLLALQARPCSLHQLARELDVTTRTIRFYEAKGLILPARLADARERTKGCVTLCHP